MSVGVFFGNIPAKLAVEDVVDLLRWEHGTNHPKEINLVCLLLSLESVVISLGRMQLNLIRQWLTSQVCLLLNLVCVCRLLSQMTCVYYLV